MGRNLRALEWCLAELMSNISERCYCAGWMSYLEYDLWEIATTDRRNYGQDTVSEDEVVALRELSRLCNGWVVWDNGETFVPLSVWHELYKDPKVLL